MTWLTGLTGPRLGVRIATAVLSLALAGTLAGCGEDQQERYCGVIKDDRVKIDDLLSSDSPGALVDNLPLLEQLQKKSPDDLSDEWQTFVGALQTLRSTLRRVGVEPGDFKDGKPPSGLSVAKVKLVSDAADQLGDPDVVAAAQGIDQQARDVCGVNLGL